jgi:transcriptional regulator with XRE-family HTH domain
MTTAAPASQQVHPVQLHREKMGWTYNALAVRAGISPHVVKAIETGRTKRPRRATLAVLAIALAVPVEALRTR